MKFYTYFVAMGLLFFSNNVQAMSRTAKFKDLISTLRHWDSNISASTKMSRKKLVEKQGPLFLSALHHTMDQQNKLNSSWDGTSRLYKSTAKKLAPMPARELWRPFQIVSKQLEDEQQEEKLKKDAYKITRLSFLGSDCTLRFKK